MPAICMILAVQFIIFCFYKQPYSNTVLTGNKFCFTVTGNFVVPISLGDLIKLLRNTLCSETHLEQEYEAIQRLLW